MLTETPMYYLIVGVCDGVNLLIMLLPKTYKVDGTTLKADKKLAFSRCFYPDPLTSTFLRRNR